MGRTYSRAEAQAGAKEWRAPQERASMPTLQDATPLRREGRVPMRIQEEENGMSKIVIGKHDKHDISLDLDILLTTRLLVTADSGGGKTFALKRICEQAFGKIQIIVVDPEGEFSPLRQKLNFVLVGKGGDTPADTRSAALVAERLLELRASAICDIYEMKPSLRHEWVRLFLDGLIEAPKRLRHPCMVIVDEAHLFNPEHGKGESVASESMKSLCTRGRKRLLCAVFATQRLATLSKDSSSMLLNRLIGPTFEDVNRKRAAETLSIPREDQAEFFKEIQMLEPGYFFALGRAISKERVLVRVGPIETPHGQDAIKYELAPPPPPEKIKELLPKLADLPKEAEDKARTVSELNKQIRELKQESIMLRTKVASRDAALNTAAHTVDVGYERNVTQLLKEERLYSERLLRYCQTYFTKIRDVVGNMRFEPPQKSISKKAWPVDTSNPVGGIQRKESGGVERLPIPGRGAKPAPRTNDYLHPANFIDDAHPVSNGKLRAGAERMLAALAQWSPQGMPEGQMRSHAGLKKSGTFSTYLSDLRRGGYVREEHGILYATDEGLDYCKHVPAAPATTEEVLAIWNPKLRDGARRMLASLVELGGDFLTKEELGEKANLAKSGTFSTYLSDLKTARLAIVNRDGTVAANKETLFL